MRVFFGHKTMMYTLEVGSTICLFSVKVCPWYKNLKNSKKTGNHAGVRYVPKLSVPGIQFRVVPVSLRVFSGHKTMMYTMKGRSTTFTNLRRHRGLDFH